MKLSVLIPLYLLYFVNAVYSQVSIQPQYEFEEYSSVIFKEASPFELKCNITVVGDKGSSKLVVVWRRNGVRIEELKELEGRWRQENDGDMYVLKVSDAKYSDAGDYSCETDETDAQGGQSTKKGVIHVGSLIAVKVPTNINVVEEETLKVECETLGNPPPVLSWHISSTTYNGTNFNESTDRVQLKPREVDGVKIENAFLVIENIVKEDRGTYTCIGTSSLNNTNVQKSAYVRVKDKYAALWPFLCICIEVIILCAIIIIYEKKRNKTELEESDTDQSPDQKNTPDNGKEANLRHRQ